MEKGISLVCVCLPARLPVCMYIPALWWRKEYHLSVSVCLPVCMYIPALWWRKEYYLSIRLVAIIKLWKMFGWRGTEGNREVNFSGWMHFRTTNTLMSSVSKMGVRSGKGPKTGEMTQNGWKHHVLTTRGHREVKFAGWIHLQGCSAVTSHLYNEWHNWRTHRVTDQIYLKCIPFK